MDRSGCRDKYSFYPEILYSVTIHWVGKIEKSRNVNSLDRSCRTWLAIDFLIIKQAFLLCISYLIPRVRLVVQTLINY